MTKDQAIELLHKNMQNQNLRRHCYAVGFAMKGIYEYLDSISRTPAESVEDWQVLGILHDSDYEITKEDWTRHTILLLEWLKEFGMSETDPIYLAVMSHNNKVTGLREPVTDMEWALECCDELTGFIVACALVKGGKLSEVTLETVKKKWPQKAFAAGVIREQTEQCQEKLGVSLDGFISIVLKSMQENCDKLGL
ncbi:phosphohydrolase [candidate division WWE3 bacterium CG_4_9_14_0_2_um_filter_35_11]|uniref:Phosphohydrolase n=1 Tax=candidate division WWE3 bacterium CG_4_9_14_0_2_um_filter_35_11 TaxID=1975077 RepID=A0A2M8ELP2_UNCKA|nr:MAG: phosphohydrolase [candidate division WWE3 bacterium CG_4_9_14_0_2_um_filter_35_11]